MFSSYVKPRDDESISSVLGSELKAYTFNNGVAQKPFNKLTHAELLDIFYVFEDNSRKVSPQAYASREEYYKNDDKYFKLMMVLRGAILRLRDIVSDTPGNLIWKLLDEVERSPHLQVDRFMNAEIIPTLKDMQANLLSNRRPDKFMFNQFKPEFRFVSMDYYVKTPKR